MALSSTSVFTHSTLTQTFLTFKTLFNRSLPGWLLIFLLTNLRLNSCSSNSKTNLPKCTTLHLTPPTVLEILALFLTNILLSLTKLHLYLKPVTITFVNFAVSGHTSIRQLPVPLQPLSFTLNLNTVILSTMHSLDLNCPVSNRSRTLLLVLLLKLLKVLPHHSHHTLSPLAQNQWTHRIQAPFSYLQSSHNYPTSILHNLISVQRPCSTRSSSVFTLARPHSSSCLKTTDRSFCYASPCLWNQLHLFVNLILVPVPPFSTHLFLHPSLPLSIYHMTLLIHNSLSLSLPA